SPISAWMRATSSTVLRRVDPPAPQVTETNDGASSFRAAIARKSVSEPECVLRGQNLHRYPGRPPAEPVRDPHDFSAGAHTCASRRFEAGPILTGANASARARRRVLTSRLPAPFTAGGTRVV